MLLIAIIGATAQISELFDRYADTDGVTTVYISKSLLKMMPDVKTEGLDIKGISNKLETIRILTTENKSIAEKLKNDISKKLRPEEYEEMLKVNEGKEKTMIYMKSGDKEINEFLIINQESREINIIQIIGKITPNDIQKIVNGSGQ